VALIVAGALLSGRRDETLPAAYGHRRGLEWGKSVNGTAVLADMFRRSGSRVTTYTRFSPRAERCDTLVWFPDDFEPPTAEQREWLEDWLATGPGRTLVYVGRDYDAAVAYWNTVAATAPPNLAGEIERRRAEARADWEARRSAMPLSEYAGWFTVARDGKPTDARQLSGPWAEGIDATKTAIHLEGRLRIPTEADRKAAKSDEAPPPESTEALLTAGGDELVTRLTDPGWEWDDSQILIVTNGSFLLNYPLVNHENRKLAARLVAACGPGNVGFVESGKGGPKILDHEPTGGLPTGLELVKVWPLNVILMHLAILGIVLCLSRAAIFGRPRELPAESTTDFGQHVAALGKLLARTKDRAYAQSRLAQYRQLAQRRSGRTHTR
jgi:hypothetical protein